MVCQEVRVLGVREIGELAAASAGTEISALILEIRRLGQLKDTRNTDVS